MVRAAACHSPMAMQKFGYGQTLGFVIISFRVAFAFPSLIPLYRRGFGMATGAHHILKPIAPLRQCFWQTQVLMALVARIRGVWWFSRLVRRNDNLWSKVQR
jgi:hypothetical protein